MRRLDGRACVVVGGGQTPGTTLGNGRATALRFAQEGARVLVAETWSDANGAYLFELIDPSQRYTVVSYDHKQMYRAVIADNLRPEMMP